MTDKELDELMRRKAFEVIAPKYVEELDIEQIIGSAKENKINNKMKVSAIAASIIVIVSLCIMCGYKLKIESENTEKTDEVAKVDSQTQESYGIIEIEDENQLQDSSACYISFPIKELYEQFKEDTEYERGVIIGKVNSIEYINYDKTWGVDMDIKYEYVPPRTVANVTISKCLIGDYNIGDVLDIRAKGGMVEYDEYMKYYSQYRGSTLDFSYVSDTYEAYVKQNRDKVYVSEFRKNDTRLEEGKTYIMFIYKKISDDYWMESCEDWLREYDEETNSLLNNSTGKYEDMDNVLN